MDVERDDEHGVGTLAFMGLLVGRSDVVFVRGDCAAGDVAGLSRNPTTLVCGRVRRVRPEGEALRRRHVERLSREAATARWIEGDEAWAERGMTRGRRTRRNAEPWAIR